MSNTQHTPGPWAQRRDNPKIIAGGFRGRTVATCETEEDAHIIATALDLLTLAYNVVNIEADENNPFEVALVRDARAAIAKATGNT